MNDRSFNIYLSFLHLGGSYGLSRRQSYGKPGSQYSCKFRSGGEEESRCSGRFLKTYSQHVFFYSKDFDRDMSGASPFIRY